MKLIIFDMDGVIVDSEHIYSAIDEEIYKRFNICLSQEKKDSFIGKNSLDIWTEIYNDHSLHNKISLEDLIILQRKMYINSLNDLLMVEGVRDWMKYFKKNNIKMIIASSSPKEIITFVIKKFKLDEYIGGFVHGDEVTIGKPNPEIFIKAASIFNEKPKDCLVIEDSSNGVKAAKAADMKCIGYKNINSGKQDLSKADYICSVFNLESLSEILN